MAAPKPALITGMIYHPTFAGDEGLVLYFPEGAGSTFVKGDLLSITTTTGRVAAVAAGDAGAVSLIGIADSNASGVTDHLVRVRVFRPNDIWEAKVASGVTFALASNQINATGYDLTAGTVGSGNGPVVSAATTNPKVIILGTLELTPSDAAITPFSGSGGDMNILATAGGPVLVKIKAVTAVNFMSN